MAEQPESSSPAQETPQEVLQETVQVIPHASVVSDARVLIARPFRVKLRGSVLVLLRLPNRRDVRAAIHQLSVTGGVVHLEKPLDEKLEVQVIFHLNGIAIREKAQMLFPMWATQGWMQPFRFLELTGEGRETLDAGLKSLIGEAAKGASAGA